MIQGVSMSPGYSLAPEQVGQVRSLPQSINSAATQPPPAAYLSPGPDPALPQPFPSVPAGTGTGTAAFPQHQMGVAVDMAAFQSNRGPAYPVALPAHSLLQQQSSFHQQPLL